MSRIVKGQTDKVGPLVKAVEEVISQVDNCPADDCGSNLIRDILIPAYRDYQIDPEPYIERRHIG